ncbi:MAG: methyl-accepting chemotaxis sensory transducer, partial [Rhodospirillaceae bacterium]
MKMTICAKLLAGFAVPILVILLMASVTTVGINAPRDMQDDGAKRAEAAVVATEAAGMGAKTYRFIADSVINRNLDTSEWAAEWATIKSEITMDTKNIENMADTDKETRLAEEGKAALLAIVALFE